MYLSLSFMNRWVRRFALLTLLISLVSVSSLLRAGDETIYYFDAEDAEMQDSPYTPDTYPKMFYDNRVHYRVMSTEGGGKLPVIVASGSEITPRYGKHCIRFEANPDPYVKDRTELVMAVAYPEYPGLPFHEEFFTGFSLYIPSGFALPDNWFVAVQWWQDGTVSPPLSMNLKNENGKLVYRFEGYHGPVATKTYVNTGLAGELQYDTWMDFVVQYRFDPSSAGGSNGYVKLWKDSVHQGDYNGLIGYSTGPQRVNHKFGLYRGQSAHSHKLYFDEFALGKSYRSVQPGMPKSIAPLVYLDMENNVTNQGFGLNAQLVNGPNYTTSSRAKGSRSLNLNGSNQYVKLADDGKSFYSEEAYNHSIALWIKPDTLSGVRNIYDRCNRNVGTDGVNRSLGTVLRQNGNKLEAIVRSYNMSNSFTLSWTGLTTDWTHVALVYEPEKLHLYVNGILRTTKAIPNFDFLISLGGAYLGARVGGDMTAAGTGAYFDGKIDDVWIYPKSLSAREVVRIMHGIESPKSWVNIRNRWTNPFNGHTPLMHVQRGNTTNVQCTAPSQGEGNWHAADWEQEEYQPGWFRLKNRRTGNYLNIGVPETENIALRCTPVGATAYSAQWAFESTSSGYFRLKNRWKGTYLHVRAGGNDIPIVTDVDSPSAGGVQWKKVSVSGTSYFRLKSRRQGDIYLHVEGNDYTHPLATPINDPEWVPELWSSQWDVMLAGGTKWYHLKNRLTGGYIHNTDNLSNPVNPIADIVCTNISNGGYWSTQWAFDYRANEGFDRMYWIQSRWEQSDYLHTQQTPEVRSTGITPSWYSAQWALSNIVSLESTFSSSGGSGSSSSSSSSSSGGSSFYRFRR